MAEATGFNVHCALDVGATWGTAVDCNQAAHGFIAKSLTVADSWEELPIAGFNQSSFTSQTTDVGRMAGAVSWTVDATYQGLELMHALLYGAAAVADDGGGPGPYKHNLTWSNSLLGTFGTLAYKDGRDVEELDSVKLVSMTANHEAGHNLELTFNGIYRRRQNGTTGSPATTSLASATLPAVYDRVQMLDIASGVADCQIITQGGTLADLNLNSWTFTLARTAATDNRAYDSTNGVYMREPRFGAATCTGSIVVPHDQVTYMDTAVQAGTIYELKLQSIKQAVTKELGYYHPAVKFTGGGPAYNDKANVPQTLNFTSTYATGSPSWGAPIGTTGPSVQMYNSLATAGLS